MLLKVCPQQYEYYLNETVSSRLLKRVMREFNLDFPTSEGILETLMQGQPDEVFDLDDSIEFPPIPAHDKDSRRLYFLPTDQYEWLTRRLEEAVGGDYYVNLGSLSVSSRNQVLTEFQDEFFSARLSSEDRERIAGLGKQYFMGIRDLAISPTSNPVEITDWIRLQVASGSPVSEAVVEFLSHLPRTASDLEKVTAFSAVADVLYEAAEEILKDRM